MRAQAELPVPAQSGALKRPVAGKHDVELLKLENVSNCQIPIQKILLDIDVLLRARFYWMAIMAN